MCIYEFKSIGSSQTLPDDTIDWNEINSLMRLLADNVERRMKRKNAAGRSVQITIRYHDRKTITRSRKLQTYIDQKADILFIANELFEQHWNGEPIRLLGITVQDVEEKQQLGQQLDLFTYENEAKKEKLYAVIDDLAEKYGKNPFKQLEGNEKKDTAQP